METDTFLHVEYVDVPAFEVKFSGCVPHKIDISDRVAVVNKVQQFVKKEHRNA